jgi:hypothetical protein
MQDRNAPATFAPIVYIRIKRVGCYYNVYNNIKGSYSPGTLPENSSYMVVEKNFRYFSVRDIFFRKNHI